MGFIALMTPEFSMINVLAFVCATLWTACYIAVIRIGFKEKTYSMPLEALAFNFAWEIIFGIVWYLAQPGQNLQAYVNILWGAFDVAIVCTFFLYAKTRGVSDYGFKLYGAGVLFFAFAILGAAFYNNFPEIENLHAVSAWLVNGIMSLMFIRMLWSRGPAGQSLIIAWTKGLGTFAVTLAYTFPETFGYGHAETILLMESINYPVIIATGWICAIFDCCYIWMLRRALRND